MRRRVIAAALVLLVAGGPARAQGPAELPAGPDAPIEEVLVTGVQPGPGLWKVTRPADPEGHVLWILGSYSPLPRKMDWRSRELEAVLASSQELIEPPSVNAKMGPLGGVTLLPSALALRRNPGDARLQDVVPPELYARWLPLKVRYLGDEDDVERWRPVVAAQELYSKALQKAGFAQYGVVWPAVEKLARKARVEVTSPEVRVRIEEPRKALRALRDEPLDDLECFERTLDRLESDLELMRVRANAWAAGDVAKLRALAPVDLAGACIAVVMGSQVARERGLADLPERTAEAWLAAAEAALARNASTVAVLSIDRLLRPDGYLDRLRARGFRVEDP
jgi:uncharacterized protein YbaP (TraB family)